MGGPIGLWAAAEWRRRWPALIGIAVLVAGLILGPGRRARLGLGDLRYE